MVTPPEPVVDHLTIERVRRHLTAQTLGQHLYLFGVVRSTNAVLRDLARAGLGEGTVVLAEEQTAGRRRLGAPWFSPPGVNLYVSVLLRPSLSPAEVPVFAFIGSLALVEAIAGEGVTATTRWPNDVMIGARKVGGTLVEYATSGPRVASVVLGVGVNLNVSRADLQRALGAEADGATSVVEATGRPIDRNLFAAAVLNSLETWYGRYRVPGGAETVLAAWRERDSLRGRRLQVQAGEETYAARAEFVDSDGSLVVEEEGGRQRRVVSGVVRLGDPDEAP